MTVEIEEKGGQEKNALFYGIALLIAFTLIFEVIPIFSLDGNLRYLSFSVYGLFKFGLIFYGQSSIKKLNRNYGLWSVALFFCTSVSLIIIGQLSKLHKEPTILKYETSSSEVNPNNFPDLTVSTDSNMLLEALYNDSFTLKHMLVKYKDYLKDNSMLFPIVAAYQLNSLGEKLNSEALISLDNYARDFGKDSFSHLTAELTVRTPEEIRSMILGESDLKKVE